MSPSMRAARAQIDKQSCRSGKLGAWTTKECSRPSVRGCAQLRLEREATLTDLAEETGISVSTLSRLESGQRKPTLELLLPLARAHRVALDELVDAPETGDPRVRSKPVVRHGRTFISLTRRPGGLQSFKMVMPAEKDAAPDARRPTRATSGSTSSAAGSGWCSASRDLVLEPGEVVEFDTRTPHWIGNPGPAPAEVLAIFGPQGERMHVRS